MADRETPHDPIHAVTVREHLEQISLERDKRYETRFASAESRLTLFVALTEKSQDAVLKELSSLRESRSEAAGTQGGSHAVWGYLAAGVAVVVSILTAVLALLQHKP